MPRRLSSGGLLVIAAALTGCFQSTWETTVVQPKLALGNDVQRTSYPLVIKMSDMDLPRFCKKLQMSPTVRLTVSCWDMDLLNTAYFVLVSRDRMRFHVTLHHKWETMSDPTRWQVWIEDERGRRYYPEGIDRRNLRPVTQMYSTIDDPDNRTPLLAITVWRGDGDYVFYRRNLFRREMTRMTLVMKRPGYTYRYVWSFVDAEGIEPPERVSRSAQ